MIRLAGSSTTNYTVGVETQTNDIWGGKSVYFKAIDVGAMPNNGVANIAHNITGIDEVLPQSNMIQQSSSQASPVTFINGNLQQSLWLIDPQNGGNITTLTNANFSTNTGPNVLLLYYTKL